MIPRSNTNLSAVSQRDIHRCLKLIEFFHTHDWENNDRVVRRDIVKRQALFAVIVIGASVKLAIGFTYYLRLSTDLRIQFSQDLEGRNAELLSEEIDRYTSDTNMVFPTGIAKNKALKENLFFCIVCIAAKIPGIIVGPVSYLAQVN